MERSEYPLVHITLQPGPRRPVRIVGNTEGLLTLATSLIEATSILGKGIAEAFCADGEAFEIQVVRADSDLAWSELALPYSIYQEHEEPEISTSE